MILVPVAHQVRAVAGGAGRTATGPFTVSGTRVLGHGGQPFISYGITVPGLQVLNWASFGQLDQEKIAAVAHDSCANTVRLQLGPVARPREPHQERQRSSRLSRGESHRPIIGP